MAQRAPETEECDRISEVCLEVIDLISSASRALSIIPFKIQDLLFETEQLAAQCGKTCAHDIGHPFVARIGDDPQ